jgi:hypothetical protein
MKLEITKENGTKLVKEFKDSNIEAAKALGWKEVGAKVVKKKSKKKK